MDVMIEKGSWVLSMTYLTRARGLLLLATFFYFLPQWGLSSHGLLGARQGPRLRKLRRSLLLLTDFTCPYSRLRQLQAEQRSH